MLSAIIKMDMGNLWIPKNLLTAIRDLLEICLITKWNEHSSVRYNMKCQFCAETSRGSSHITELALRVDCYCYKCLCPDFICDNAFLFKFNPMMSKMYERESGVIGDNWDIFYLAEKIFKDEIVRINGLLQEMREKGI